MDPNGFLGWAIGDIQSTLWLCSAGQLMTDNNQAYGNRYWVLSQDLSLETIRNAGGCPNPENLQVSANIAMTQFTPGTFPNLWSSNIHDRAW